MNFIKSHWNLKYLKSKILQRKNMKSEPYCPWLVFDAVKFLKQYLNKNDTILEIGSGNSTIWFSQFVKKIYSIESNEEWYKKIDSLIKKKNILNVSYYLESTIRNPENNSYPYVEKIKSLPDNFFDVILIDGKLRDLCAISSLDKIKPDGLIIIDNVERYIYDQENIPGKLENANKTNESWNFFINQTKTVRKVIFYDGISSTMLLFMGTKIN